MLLPRSYWFHAPMPSSSRLIARYRPARKTHPNRWPSRPVLSRRLSHLPIRLDRAALGRHAPAARGAGGGAVRLTQRMRTGPAQFMPIHSHDRDAPRRRSRLRVPLERASLGLGSSARGGGRRAVAGLAVAALRRPPPPAPAAIRPRRQPPPLTGRRPETCGRDL